MLGKIDPRLEGIQSRYSKEFEAGIGIASKLEMEGSLNYFDRLVVERLFQQIGRAVNPEVTFPFQNVPEVARFINSSKSGLYNNIVFIDYVAGALTDFIVHTPYYTNIENESLAGRIKGFSDEIYINMHRNILSTNGYKNNEKSAKEIMTEFYRLHIRPCLNMGKLILENQSKHKEYLFSKDFSRISSLFEDGNQYLAIRVYPYNLIKTNMSHVLDTINKQDFQKNYHNDTRTQEREVIINLYAAAYLLNHIASTQLHIGSYPTTINKKPSRPDDSDTRIALALKNVLEQI